MLPSPDPAQQPALRHQPAGDPDRQRRRGAAAPPVALGHRASSAGSCSVFGPLSSLFDFLTFGVMLRVFHAHAPQFRSGWFVESLATQTLVIFAIRTRRVPFFRSRPSLALARRRARRRRRRRRAARHSPLAHTARLQPAAGRLLRRPRRHGRRATSCSSSSPSAVLRQRPHLGSSTAARHARPPGHPPGRPLQQRVTYRPTRVDGLDADRVPDRLGLEERRQPARCRGRRPVRSRPSGRSTRLSCRPPPAQVAPRRVGDAGQVDRVDVHVRGQPGRELGGRRR